MVKKVHPDVLARMRAGEKPTAPKPTTPIVAAGAQDEVLGLLEQEYEKPAEQFKKTWNPTLVKILVGFAILLGLILLAWVALMFFGSKGVVDKVVAPGSFTPQSLLPALRHLAEAGSSFY